MNKKNYLIIGLTISAFVIAIITILILNNNKGDWTTDILKASSYEIRIINCNGREKELEQNVLTTLSGKWNTLSNNGPWTGNTNTCYTTITISYDTNGIVKQKQILLIDETSLVLDLGTSTIYYTNAKDIIDYLNNMLSQ